MGINRGDVIGKHIIEYKVENTFSLRLYLPRPKGILRNNWLKWLSQTFHKISAGYNTWDKVISSGLAKPMQTKIASPLHSW